MTEPQPIQTRRSFFRRLAGYGFGPLTMLLMLVSLVIYVRSKFNQDFKLIFYSQDLRQIYALFISGWDNQGGEEANAWKQFLNRVYDYQAALPEIRQGQVWRLITPIFIHLSFFRIFFNLLWLRDLGSMVERRQGSLTLLALVLIFGSAGNVAQYFMHGPAFGGMSCVAYALVAYIWVRGHLDPASRLQVHPATVAIMFIWFFVCLVGLQGGSIETTAAGVGVLLGVSWGGISGLLGRRMHGKPVA